MAASSTDKFIKVGEATATTLSAPGYTIGANSITVASTTNWPTDTGVVFAIDTVQTVAGEEVAVEGSYCEFVGTVASATSITNVSLVNGTPQDYASGASTRVYISVSSETQNRMVDGILTEHNQNGTHKNITATSVTATTGTITNLTSTTGTFTNLIVGSQTPSADWTTTVTPTSVTALGNGSYSVVIPGNVTGAINPGTRLRSTRTVSAPTQCTSLNGTTQYYSKTTPAGMTFTDDFVVSAWIKLSSYQAGTIISRFNGTSGWSLNIYPSGQVVVESYNSGGANFSIVSSVQSVPLNKWTHIAVQQDMSAFTATTTTSYVMINGVDVPVTLSRGGTNPTSLVQAGNLEVGTRNGGIQFFAGKIAQAAVYSAKVTQATILASMNQGLAGTETSLISAYSFNNSINDLNTTNANNLTANGSAVATNADSPFGGQANGSISATLDYGIGQSTSFSTNTTVVVQVPEGNTFPTSGGLAALSYSSAGKPYGMAVESDKFRISTILKTSNGTTANANYGSFLSGGFLLSVPAGIWIPGWRAANAYNVAALAVRFLVSPVDVTGLSATAAAIDFNLSQALQSPSAAVTGVPFYAKGNAAKLASQTTYRMYTLGNTASAGLDGSTGIVEIFAELGNL